MEPLPLCIRAEQEIWFRWREKLLRIGVVLALIFMGLSALDAQLSDAQQGTATGDDLTDQALGELGRANVGTGGNVGPLLELPDVPYIDLNIRQPQTNREVALSLQLLLLLTVITLAPTFAVLLTSFLRISIVLDFIRRAMALQQAPPTNVIMGIALFMAVFVMWPVLSLIYDNAFVPFSDGQIDLQEFYLRTRAPLKQFMFQQLAGDTRSLELFLETSRVPQPRTLADIPLQVLVPSYILHELTVAFRIGILIYIPFIIIDMVVSAVLMSMGMIMLPPVMISTPFKLLLFVMVDGWNLIARQVILSIQQNMGGFS
ncbi:flagellar type III secretion system pore protein FliP [Candidatus Haliotispira prima]|uniref:flagellar type III secretion system pore protein FliP n=1 Tax=Candidatus Haliotispira prima TaxID=3034016 RepID=UPI003898E987